MLINAIRAENIKSRHSNIWVAVIILPLLTAMIGAIIYGINASANLYDGAVWQQLWLQTGLFYGYFFFPILIAQALLMIFVLIVGKFIFHFTQPVPINMVWWLFMGWFSALSVGAVQLYLSMRIRSFAVPVGLAVCLSIVGLAFHIVGLSSMFPYSQIILGLSSQDKNLPVESIVTFVPMIIIYTVIFIVLATRHLKKADIVAG